MTTQTSIPTDYDEHHVYTAAEMNAKPRIFRMLAMSAISRDGFYTYTAIQNNAPELRVLVTIKE